MAKHLSDHEGFAENYGETTTLPDIDARSSSGDADCAASFKRNPKAPPSTHRFPLLWVKSHQAGGRTYHCFRRPGFPTARPARRTGLPKFLAI